MENNDALSALKLERLVFDKISFDRKGFRNDDYELNLQLNIKIGETNDSNTSIVTLIITGDKETEYSFTISLSGFFTFDANANLEHDLILKQNAVAILMPYMRSQITLLTAQPETESVVLPPLNILSILNDQLE